MRMTFIINRGIFLLLMLVNCVSSLDSSSMQLSRAYGQLWKNKKTRNDWWYKCRLVRESPKRLNVEIKYSFSCNSSEVIQPKVEEHISVEGSGTQEEKQITIIDVFWIIQEQIFNLFYESMEEILQMVNIEKNVPHPVVYDDNFAGLNQGALILKKSSNLIHSAQAILEDSSDHYLYTDAPLPIQIIIALKQEMTINRIRIKSSEIYSSTVKDFILEGAFAIDIDTDEPHLKNWFRLLQTRAKNNVNEQQFLIANRVIRFLKLTILTKYGDWKYFTMTQIKVYGKGLFVEAMSDFQQVQQSNESEQVSTNSIALSQPLGEMFKTFLPEPAKKPDHNMNMITFLFEKVDNLTRVQQQQFFYMSNLTDKISRLQEQKQEKDKTILDMGQKLQKLVDINDRIAKLNKANRKSLDILAFFRDEIETIKRKKIEIAVAEEILAKNRLFEQNLYLIVVVIVINASLSALIICLCFRFYAKKSQTRKGDK